MSARFCMVTVAAVALLATACTMGTSSEDELWADYEVQPESDPLELLDEVDGDVADELDTDAVRYLELQLNRTGHASVVAQNPSKQGRLYSFHYDLFWLEDGELESTDVEETEPLLFGLDEIALDRLPDLVELGRAQMEFSPASLTSVSFERNPDEGMRLEIEISYRNFEHNGQARFDGAGEPIVD